VLDYFSGQQLAFFAILVVAFGVLLTERLRNDLVALLIILALYISGVLQSSDALAGFSSEPAIIVAAIFVLSGALHQTGLSNIIGAWIGRLAGSGYSRALAVIMPSVALLSAFTYHVTTTAVMLPVTLNLSRERDIPGSKLFAPVAIALAQALGHPPEPYVVTVAMAAVAAFLTPIGHHGNLLVYGPGRYQFADFVRVGTPLTVVCALVVALLAPLIWPA
jgi:di/tricarboxylate transporter